MKKKEKKTITISEDAFIALGVAILNAKEVLGKKCEYCGCYGGIHKSSCLFMLKLY
jgi:hypothetical protein